MLERNFKVNGLEIAARQWGDIHTGKPVIAIHGWLDNSGSFDAIAALMPNCCLIALDLAGHGHSSHRSAHGSYNIWDDLIDVLAVADQLGWERFHLLSHSRGAIASFLLAASQPQRVEKLVMLDGIFVMPADAEDAAKQLGEYLTDQRNNFQRQSRTYASRDEALGKRCEKTGLSPQDCTPLMDRGLQSVAQGFAWGHDNRLMGASAFKLTSDHQQAFLKALTVPSLLVLAERGFSKWTELVELISKYPTIDIRHHAGGHHMHMDSDHVASLSALIEGWIIDG